MAIRIIPGIDGPVSLVQLIDASGADIGGSNASPAIIASKNTGLVSYMATGLAYPGYATPEDMIAIVGSATKIVRVHALNLRCHSTAAALLTMRFMKRTAITTGGTSTQATAIKVDTAHGGVATPAATAVVNLYTATPSMGAGAPLTYQIGSTAAATAAPGTFSVGGVYLANSTTLISPIVLRGVNESLAANLAGAPLPAGFSCLYEVIWTESDS